jgi:nonsense-mediated mRNA decay protein 3
MSDLVCPKCGKKSSEAEFIESFCSGCYPVKIKTPDRFELEQCTRCSKVHLRGDWAPYNARKLSDYIIGKCKGDFSSAGYDADRQVAVFIMMGNNAKIERLIPLDLKKTICLQCSRMSGGYFEAIIQLRGDPIKVLGHSGMLLKRLSKKKTFIAKEEEKDGGLDLYVGNSKVVVELMGELGLKTLITKKLVGRDQGKRLYRTTFLIRL